MDESLYWADQKAREIIRTRGEKPKYVCAAGISPSGSVHFGNFREVATVDLVVRALKDAGKKVRFLYSWDDFDRFRKVPAGVSKEWCAYVGMPLSKVPDPAGCHDSYAEHNEKIFENSLKKVNITADFLRQSELYGKCVYAKEIRKAMQSIPAIKEVLNKYRKEELPNNWYPIQVYCEDCWKDSTKLIGYDGEYSISYACECGHSGELDFRKTGNVKLRWKVDWPMRWTYYGVDFEPAGKEHSTKGSSRDVGTELIRSIYGAEAPAYLAYDIIRLKGEAKKMSGSLGNALTLDGVLNYYLPELARFFYAKSRPDTEITLPLDLDLVKFYEDFYETERLAYSDGDDKKTINAQRVYSMSLIKSKQRTLPVQPGLRMMVMLTQLIKGRERERKAVEMLKRIGVITKRNVTDKDYERVKELLERAGNWLEEYAPENFRIEMPERIPRLKDNEEKALIKLKDLLMRKDWSADELHNEFYGLCTDSGLSPKEFFRAAYLALTGQEAGPRLSQLIIAIGRKDVITQLSKVKA